MIFTDEQLKGNWAEQFIASKLASQGCLIRHVTQGHDSGIDLYCESTINGEPFLHFWVQVKCRKSWGNDRKKVWYTPKKKNKEKEYWLRQAILVYLFCVPDNRFEPSTPYHICFTWDLLKPGTKSLRPFDTIHSSDGLLVFIESMLPAHTYLWDLKEGKVSYLKASVNSYTKFQVPGYSQLFESKLRRSIYVTLHRLSSDILWNYLPFRPLQNEIRDEDLFIIQKAKPYILALEKYIAEIDDKHYENYRIIGYYYELIGQYDSAISFMNKTLEILESDPHIDLNKGIWSFRYQDTKKDISRINSKLKKG